MLAQVDISLRLPGGERVQVAVRSTSHRRSSAIAASVVLDGTMRGRTSDGRAVPRTGPRGPAAPVTRRNGEPSVELVGYAQPCVAYPGGTVDVKVSSTAARVHRGGGAARPAGRAAAPPVGGRFPGRYQELVSGSYLVADLSRAEPATAGQTAALWFCPTWLSGPQCLMAGQARDGGWELGIGEDHRVRVAVRAESDGPPRGHSAGPVLETGHWYFAAASWDSEGRVTLVVLPRSSRSAVLPAASALPADAGPHQPRRPLPGRRAHQRRRAVRGPGADRCFNGKIDTPRLFSGRAARRQPGRPRG